MVKTGFNATTPNAANGFIYLSFSILRCTSNAKPTMVSRTSPSSSATASSSTNAHGAGIVLPTNARPSNHSLYATLIEITTTTTTESKDLQISSNTCRNKTPTIQLTLKRCQP
jgi:hypothetical protein